MACESSSPSSPRYLLVAVAIIGLASSLLIDCVQDTELLTRLSEPDMNSSRVLELLIAVTDKDKTELGNYSVSDILEIKHKYHNFCYGRGLISFRTAMDYYAFIDGLYKFYAENYADLIQICSRNLKSIATVLQKRLTPNDQAIMTAFVNQLPVTHLYLSDRLVARALISYLETVQTQGEEKMYLQLAMQEELESTCKRIIRQTSSFTELRSTREWHENLDDTVVTLDKANRACQIYLDKLAPSVLKNSQTS